MNLKMPSSALPEVALIMPARMKGWLDCSMQIADEMFKFGER